MTDIATLLQHLGLSEHATLKLLSVLATVAYLARFLRPLLTRFITFLLDRFDDVSSRGQSEGEALLIIVNSGLYRWLAFLFDFLFRIHLPTEASLKERWEKLEIAAVRRAGNEMPDGGSPLPDAGSEKVDGRRLTGIGAFAALLATSLICFTACKNPELAAYRTIGGVAATVETAMTAWGDWVKAKRATPDDEVRVKAAYVKYQAAMKVAEQSVKTARNLPPGTASYAAIVSILSESADPLVALIDTFVPNRPR